MGTMVGLWMNNEAEANIMLRALEARLRNIGPTDPDRRRLEQWREEALNIPNRAAKEEWHGWTAP